MTGLRDDHHVLRVLLASRTGHEPAAVPKRLVEWVEGSGYVLLGFAYFGVPIVFASFDAFGPADSVLRGGRPSVAYTVGFVAVSWLVATAAAYRGAAGAVAATALL